MRRGRRGGERLQRAARRVPAQPGGQLGRPGRRRGATSRWVRDFIADMEEFSDGSRYLNFAGFQEEGEAMMRAAFGPHYERLVALKRRYDPTNLFRLNQNIAPPPG